MCENRMKCARDLLDPDISNDDPIASKLANLFKLELEHTKESGHISKDLWQLLDDLGNGLRTDTQDPNL